MDSHIGFCSKTNNSAKADAGSPRLSAWTQKGDLNDLEPSNLTKLTGLESNRFSLHDPDA